jgi:hypothetical protein
MIGGGYCGKVQCFLSGDPDTAMSRKYLSRMSALFGEDVLRPTQPAKTSDLRDIREGGI